MEYFRCVPLVNLNIKPFISHLSFKSIHQCFLCTRKTEEKPILTWKNIKLQVKKIGKHEVTTHADPAAAEICTKKQRSLARLQLKTSWEIKTILRDCLSTSKG